MAEIADKFTRNEILSPNEIRAEIGYKPDKNPKSDELRNRNINQNTEEIQQETELPDGTVEEEDVKGSPEEVKSSGNSVEDIMKLLSGE